MTNKALITQNRIPKFDPPTGLVEGLVSQRIAILSDIADVVGALKDGRLVPEDGDRLGYLHNTLQSMIEISKNRATKS